MSQDLDEPVFMKENVRLGPFQTQILEYKVKPLIGERTHIMVTPLRAGETQPGGAWPLPSGLHVLHAYTRLKMSGSVRGGKEHVGVFNLPEEECAGGEGGFHITCPTCGDIPGDGSGPSSRGRAATPICG